MVNIKLREMISRKSMDSILSLVNSNSYYYYGLNSNCIH